MRRHHERSQGMALVEAVVASAVLAVGMLGAMRLSLHAQARAQEARVLTQAQALASEALDCALAMPTICTPNPSTTLAGVRYTVTVERTSLSPQLQALQATVEWRVAGDGSAPSRSLSWQTRISTLSDLGSTASIGSAPLGLSSP